MEQWIVQVMQSAGQWGFLIILLLMAAENIFPPIPSEVVLTCAGFLTTCSELTRFQSILSATLGSLLGAVVLYGLGRALPVEKLSHLGFQPEEIEDAERWFCKRGKIAVLLCRCVPMVRSLISIPAGTARMPMLPFLLLTAIGTAVWDTVLIGIGAAAGSSWQLAAAKVDYQSALLLMAAFSGKKAKMLKRGAIAFSAFLLVAAGRVPAAFFGVLMGKFYLTSTFIISAT